MTGFSSCPKKNARQSGRRPLPFTRSAAAAGRGQRQSPAALLVLSQLEEVAVEGAARAWVGLGPCCVGNS